MGTAAAFWVTEPGRGQIRPVTLPDPGPDDVLVRTLRTGVSRGTEWRIDPQRRRVGLGHARVVSPWIAIWARLPGEPSGAGQPLVGEREVMRCDVAGDRQASGLGGPDQGQ